MFNIKFEAGVVGARAGALRLRSRNTGFKYTFSNNLHSSLQCCRSGSGHILSNIVRIHNTDSLCLKDYFFLLIFDEEDTKSSVAVFEMGMWWLSWLRCSWVNHTATQQFWVQSQLPPQSTEGRQE
jgi:hypothetical protein